MSALEVRNLTKCFGSKRAVDNITFSVPEGSVFGFIGANGAGKTTTMKMVLGLLDADSGEIKICGETVRFGGTKVNRLVGYLSDVPEFYNYMRPKEYLRLVGEIAGMKRASIAPQVESLLTLVGLSGEKKRIGGFSRGMKQRLGMAAALFGEPRLLICDEPTSALDPIGRREILEILREIKGRTTVIFSTHILSDVERICDYVTVINAGKITMQKAMNELRVPSKTRAVTLEFDEEVDSSEILRVLEANNLKPSSFEIPAISIEEQFLEVVQ